MSFMDIVSKFNQQADSHSKTQSLNPFSEQFQPSRSPSPRFSREEYGKPIAGSKTDLRGRKAKSHICREILELCTVIHDVGTYNSKKRDPDDDDDDDGGQDDGTIIVSFGELFQIYTKISDKVVGLLIAAKRRGFVYFDREILFQVNIWFDRKFAKTAVSTLNTEIDRWPVMIKPESVPWHTATGIPRQNKINVDSTVQYRPNRRDDDVLIALLKPISEISKLLKEDINQANGVPAAPVETKPVEKNKTTSSSKTKRAKPECDKIPKVTVYEQTKVISEAVVDIVTNNGVDDDHKRNNCNEELNGVVNEEVVNNIIDISENTEDYSDRGIDDETRTDKTDAIKTTDIDDEPKTDKIDKTKTKETVETKTDEIDETRTEEIDDSKIEDTNEIKIDDTDEYRPDETNGTNKQFTEKSDETVTEKIIENETLKTEEIDENMKNENPDETNIERTGEIKIEESNESYIKETDESEIDDASESKTDEIAETKTELSDKTETEKPDKINVFSDDIKSIDLANIDEIVPEKFEKNETYVNVHENHLVDNVIEEIIEEISIGTEIE